MLTCWNTLFIVDQPTSSKAPLSGGFVQLTKLDIQELEMTELKQKLKYLEKELAKYMDIEEKRKWVVSCSSLIPFRSVKK